MAKQLSQYTVISLAENVTTLYCVLPVCQRGHSNPWSQQHHHSWRGQCDPCLWQHHCSWWCFPLYLTCEEQSHPIVWGCLYTSMSLPNVISYKNLRARKSFEHDGCSEWVFSASLASPVMGSVESRRMHQMHLVKLGVNKGGRFWDPPGICVSGIPNLAT